MVRLCDASFWTTVQSKRLWSVYAMQAFRPQSSRSACGPSIRYKLSDHSPIAAPVVRLCDASFWTTVQSKRLWSVYAMQAFGPQSRVQSLVKVRWSERPFCGKNRRQKDPQPEIQGSPMAAGKFPGILIFARHSCPVSGQTVSVFCALTVQSAGPPVERPRASPYSSTTGA